MNVKNIFVLFLILFFCNCATVRFKGQFITANNKEYNNNDLNENQKNQWYKLDLSKDEDRQWLLEQMEKYFNNEEVEQASGFKALD